MVAQSRPVRKVVVLGATGSVGSTVVNSLANHPAQYSITAVTRDKSKACFLPSVQVVESDLSAGSLQSVLYGKDAVVSCLATSVLDKQKEIADVAVHCGVVRFIPSEYGVDPTHPNSPIYLPVTKLKIAQVEKLRNLQDKMSWTTLITGSFFDWALHHPGWFGWNVAASQATIFDGGDVEYEATNLSQIGVAIGAILAPEHLNETANQHVFINSFTTTQNEVLAALEKITCTKFEVKEESTAALREKALEVQKGNSNDLQATIDLITATVYGQGGINLYSKEPGKLWNRRLGIVQEDVEDSIRNALSDHQ